jgi:FdhE protein
LTDQFDKVTSSQVLKKLEEWQGREAISSSFLDFYKELLNIHIWVETILEKPQLQLSTKVAKKKLLGGKPLLSFEEFEVDWPLVDRVFKKVITVFSEYPQIVNRVPVKLVSQSPKLLKDTARIWLAGSYLSTRSHSGHAEQDIDAVVHATLKPFLVNYSSYLVRKVDQTSWRKCYCPVCGRAPDFGFLERADGKRWLLCSRCDAHWLFQRLECPFCLNKNHDLLSFFSYDNGRYRLYVCDKCHSYIKVIDLRQTTENVLLPFERLVTYGMDYQALDKGYQPGYIDTPAMPAALSGKSFK